jgi:hypothetical protein
LATISYACTRQITSTGLRDLRRPAQDSSSQSAESAKPIADV